MLSSAVEESVNNNYNYQQACKSIAERIESSKNLFSITQVLKVIRQVASEYHLRTMPRNEHIIRYLHDNRYRRLLMVKPTKTASGVAVVAVMPKPYECPHGRCTYCPGGIEFNTPLSYTGTEPATKAAQGFSFDPYQQVHSK
ncbi:MAG: tRNA uridine(34) 5-carboxymethylaminomethyl modification radical SAM/GNAT enzyme Elp3, partial [Thermoproteota archaeon]|nr:tRNA uridine(34) 5-carboxymethylaminomethyl modification radical SAM/GNAT enzyme Elp3 [Thermoproteota archaeon]